MDSTEETCQVDFDRDGPRIGEIRLVAKTPLGFRARTASELAAIFVTGAGIILDVPRLAAALNSIANAMNAGEFGLAAITTGRLPLRALNRADLTKAEAADRLGKASPDDPEHPGYPKGAPDGRGGQFRPKNPTEDGPSSVRGSIPTKAERLERLTRRRGLRAALTRVLTLKRVARLVGENVVAGLTEAVPGLDVATDAVAAADDLAAIAEVAAFKADSEAAIAFVEKGPLDLASLRVDAADRSFGTFDAFKKIDPGKFYGTAGDGLDYHHIVEQASNVTSTAASDLQSTSNIVRIPRLLHEEINSIYATPEKIGDQMIAPRNYLRGKSFKEQYDYGLDVLRRVGVLH